MHCVHYAITIDICQMISNKFVYSLSGFNFLESSFRLSIMLWYIILWTKKNSVYNLGILFIEHMQSHFISAIVFLFYPWALFFIWWNDIQLAVVRIGGFKTVILFWDFFPRVDRVYGWMMTCRCRSTKTIRATIIMAGLQKLG